MNFVDLFSGAGGLSLGFMEAGFKPIFSVENWKPAVETHKRNFSVGKLFTDSVAELNANDLIDLTEGVEINCVVGGPPCQGFSTIGKRINEDPRNRMIFEFARIIRKLNPQAFVMENVRGMFSANNGAFKDALTDVFENLGYQVRTNILCAADFGVPQIRYRGFFIGFRKDLEITPSFPLPTNSKLSYTTVGDSIMDLVGKEGTVANHIPMKHNAIVTARISYIREGEGIKQNIIPAELLRGSRSDYKDNQLKNFSHVYKRLSRFSPSTTMVPGHNAFPLHPTENRSLTVREAARIQTFPDWFVFEGTRQEQCIQVGNAVPVLLANRLAKHVKILLEKKV